MKFKPKKWRLTIQKKLLFITMVILIVPMITMAVLSLWVSSRESDAQMRSNLRSTVKMASEIMMSFEDSVERGTMSLDTAQEQMKQLLLGTKLADGSRAINSNIDLGEHGYFFILNDQGDLLAHPSLEGRNLYNQQTSDGFYHIRDMLMKGVQSDGGFTTYRWPLPDHSDEAMKIAYSLKNAKWGWTIVAGSYVQDYMAGQGRIVQGTIFTLVVCLALATVVIIVFAMRLSKPIASLNRQAKKIAEGDLSSDNEEVIHSRDEIGDLFHSFSIMRENLRSMTSDLLAHAATLSTASRDLSETFLETTEATDRISVSSKEVAASNGAQKRSLQESTFAMNELAIDAQRIAASSSLAEEASQTTLEHAEQGNDLIIRTSEQMEAINFVVVELSAVVGRLGERSRQIGEIAEEMADLSAQTNLLSLNATIEAARAGEQGKGFAVVAGEVKKLAERSQRSAMQVGEMIGLTRVDIGAAVIAMDQGEREVTNGAELIKHSGEAFNRILLATRSAVHHVGETSSASQQISASSEEFSASLLEIDYMAERSDLLAKGISTDATHQLAVMEEISASADSLNRISEGMLNLVRRFKL